MKINYNVREIQKGDWVTDKWERWTTKYHPGKIPIYKVYYTHNGHCRVFKNGSRLPYDYLKQNLKIVIPQKKSKYIKS